MQINADMEADLSSLLFFYLLSSESVDVVASDDEDMAVTEDNY